jgi:tetratricopeptide (TPR) repeat protein
LARSAVTALGRHAETLVSSNPRMANTSVTRAIAIAEAADECFDDEIRAELSVCRARARVELGDFIGAIDDGARAESLAGEAHPSARGRALLARARALTNLGHVDDAAPAFEESVALLRSVGDLPVVADALRHQASNRRLTDRRGYLAGLHAAHSVYAEIGDLAGQRDLAADLAYELTMEGGPAFRRWLAAAQDATDLDTDVRARASLRRTEAFLAQNRGERRRARDLAVLAFADADSIGAVRITVDALLCQLAATAALGSADENARLADSATELAERLGLRRFRALVEVYTARPALLARRRAAADSRLANARALFSELGDTENRDADLMAVSIGLDAGSWHEAATLGESTISALDQEGEGLYAVPVRLDVARAALGHDPAGALGLLAEALDAARRHDTPQHGALAAACLEQAQLLSGQETSQRIGAAPERAVELDATVAENAALRSALRGEWAEAAESFAAAAAVWSEIGATVWLARALVWLADAATRAGDPVDAQSGDVVVRLLADLGAPAGLADSFAQQLSALI